MLSLLKLFFIILPPLAFLCIVRRRHFLSALLMGAVSAGLALVIIAIARAGLAWIYNSIPPILWNTTIVLAEELAKLAAFLYLLRRLQTKDGLFLYATAIGLGFASIESLLYLQSSVVVILLRVCMTTLLHIGTIFLIVFSGGYYAQNKRAKISGNSKVYQIHSPYTILSLMLQIITHLGYNLAVQNFF